VPERDAPYSERLAVYQELRPRNPSLHSYDIANPVFWGREVVLRLGGGTEIYYADDLLPAIPSDSATARHIARSSALYRKSRSVGLAAAVASGAAVPLAIVGGARLSDEPEVPGGVLVGAAVAGLLTGGVLAIVSEIQRYMARDAQITSYKTFDGALRERLGLCDDRGLVIDCGTP
jgi:hypothetical protein